MPTDPFSSERRGIVTAGLWLIDYTKAIDHYPEPTRLALISEVLQSNGGGAFNVAVDLTQLGAPFPVIGLGLVGSDAPGKWIRETARSCGIDTTHLRVSPGAATAFTDVMTERASGRRTFFYQPGANERLDANDFASLDHAREKIFFLGYPGLLPALDRARPSGTTGVVEVLQRARAAGLATVADCVSSHQANWLLIAQALPWLDVLLLNEWEADQLLQRSVPTPATSAALLGAARALLDRGVRQRVIVHAADGAVCATAEGEAMVQGAVRVATSDVKGTCGAGDALAAGVLYGLHEGFSAAAALELGVCAAATCVHDLTASGSVRRASDCLAYGRSSGFAAF